jgi:nucleoside-diphosphate-sugar epimerase
MTVHPDQIVRLVIVENISHFGTSDGKLELVEVDDMGRRFVWIKAKFAQEVLCSGLPSSVPFREANAELADALGRLRPAQGISLRYLESAMRPPSRVEILEQTLSDYRRLTGYE